MGNVTDRKSVAACGWMNPAPAGGQRRGRTLSAMLGLLRFGFVRQEAIHPLANGRKLTRALNNMPRQNWHATLSEISRLLSTIGGHLAAARVDKLCNAIRKLNEFAQAPLAEAWASVLESNAAESAARPWQALVSFYQAVHSACCHCQILADREPSGVSLQQCHAMLSALAMHALGMEKKLLRFHYHRPEEQWWAAAHWQLNQARGHGCDSSDVSIGNPETASNTLGEYKHALFFDLAPLDNLTPRQMEALDLMLRKFEKYLPFHFQSAGIEPYCVDTVSAQGPAKRRADGRYSATCGHLGFDLIRPLLQRQILRMKRSFLLPDFLRPSRCSRDEVLSMLQTLAKSWSGEPHQRRHRRRQRPALLSIGLGLEVLHQALSDETVSSPTAMAAHKQSPVTDGQARFGLLRLLNVSEQGIGILLPHLPGKFAIGSLACFQFEDGQAWRVGIVRRLSHHGDGVSTCGIEQLDGKFVSAWAMTPEDEAGSKPDASEPRDMFDVVVQPGASGQEHQILLPRGFYREGRRYLLCLDANIKHVDIILTRFVDHGPDFERAGFIAVAAEMADSYQHQRSLA